MNNPTGREPALPQAPNDDSPMLGGERAIPTLCPECGERMIRDLLGRYVCLPCTIDQLKLEAVRVDPICPHCGDRDHLDCEFAEGEKIVYVFCQNCDSVVWLDKHYAKRAVVGSGFLDANGNLEDVYPWSIPMINGRPEWNEGPAEPPEIPYPDRTR